MRLSKALSRVLRHSAEKEGLKLRPDGYVELVCTPETYPRNL